MSFSWTNSANELDCDSEHHKHKRHVECRHFYQLSATSNINYGELRYRTKNGCHYHKLVFMPDFYIDYTYTYIYLPDFPFPFPAFTPCLQ